MGHLLVRIINARAFGKALAPMRPGDKELIGYNIITWENTGFIIKKLWFS
jgi:hypothetical protein